MDSKAPVKAKSSFTSGTLGPIKYAEKAYGSMPEKKSIEAINKANMPKSRSYAPGVIRHSESRGEDATE